MAKGDIFSEILEDLNFYDIKLSLKSSDVMTTIEAYQKISSIIGSDNIYIRYDPIFINDKYSVSYHIKAFDNMCSLLNGYVKHIIV